MNSPRRESRPGVMLTPPKDVKKICEMKKKKERKKKNTREGACSTCRNYCFYSSNMQIPDVFLAFDVVISLIS